MTKTLTYLGLVIASLLVILAFVTAKTYFQLAVAVILYPTLIFLFFMIFPRKSWKLAKSTIPKQPKLNLAPVETPEPDKDSVYVADIDRRTFIKIIWATGISFLLFSLLGRRVESLFFGRGLGQQGINPTRSDEQFGQAGASPTDGYKISEIDEGTTVNYYGFVNKDGAWLIMKEAVNESSFRYAKGSSDFPGNWKNRENLRYDYFYNLF